MKNCQFKVLRENTLLTNLSHETHARQIQINYHGGDDVIKNIKYEQFKFRHNLHQLAPTKDWDSRNGKGDPSRRVKKGKKKYGREGRDKDDCSLEKTIQTI